MQGICGGRIARVGFLCLAVLIAPPAQATHETSYTFDDGTALGDWEQGYIQDGPAGYADGRLITSFPSNNVQFFGLDILPPTGGTTTIYLEFDVVLLGGWDGDPLDSLFSFSFDGPHSTTFSNIVGVQQYGDPYAAMGKQSYPASTGGNYPSGTGAQQFQPFDFQGEYLQSALEITPPQYHDIVTTLLLDGILENGVDAPLAFSSYHFSFETDVITPDSTDCCLGVNIIFSSSGGLFGIDNFAVDNQPIPEPSTAATVAIGLIGLAVARRRPARR